jgi:hypothetical protein
MNASEEVLRGETALCLMALLIDGTVERFVTVGQSDPQVGRAIEHTRAALARYIAGGAKVPAWLPQSIVTLLQETKNPQSQAA